MRNTGFGVKSVLIIAAAISTLILTRYSSPGISAAHPPASIALPHVTSAPEPQQYPIMDKIADKLIQKYQGATCEQLWIERSQKAKPKSQQEQEALQILKDDPKMRAAFLNRVAAPIANKMFECGMIP